MEVLRIGVRELGEKADEILALVKAGETVEITERGTLIALLTPPSPAESARDRLIAEGRLIPASGPLRLPARLHVDGVDSQTVLDELREERL